MRRSIDRILTTHTGSLPRPMPLVDVILGREKGEAIDAAFDAVGAIGAIGAIRDIDATGGK